MIDAYINGVSLFSRGVIVAHKEISNAEPNLKYIEIPGRNGKLDVTDFLGLTFSNRNITIECKTITDNSTDLRNTLESLYNGKVCQIKFADDMTHYWEGRVKIETFIREGSIYKFKITADVYPAVKLAHD